MVIIILKNALGFFNIFSNKELISKNNFMLTLKPIKYKFCSLIGLNFIMCQYNILHIYLHPLNMHVLSQPVPKLLHGPLPVDLQLSLTIHLYATYNLLTKTKQLMKLHTNYPEKILSQTPNISFNKTISQTPTFIHFMTDKNPIDLKLKKPSIQTLPSY